ncbi:HNH endonuclease [Mucilaginibacter sp. UC70_90]
MPLIPGNTHTTFDRPTFTNDNTRITNSVPRIAPTIVQARPRAAPGSRPGQGFTPRGKKDVIDENKAKNNGKTVCEKCGVPTTKPEKSKKGVTPPSTDTQVDHIDPSANGGSGTPENGQVLCRGCNIEKSDKVPTPPAPTPPTTKPPTNQ